MMKTIVILTHNQNSYYSNEKVFDNKSACDKVLEWADKIAEKTVIVPSGNNVGELLENMNLECKKENADNVIFSFDDVPFIDIDLTKEILNNHLEYKSEYTYADGYPYGFSPEIINNGALNILAEMAKTNRVEEAKSEISKDCIYNFLKNEINSFEVESVIAEDDYRLFRFNFSCDKKENFLACQELFNITKDKNLSVNEKCQLAVKTCGILKTVPSYYNFQIASKCSGKCIICPYASEYKKKNNSDVENSKELMTFENFSKAIKQISELSKNAVVGLSLWGECFNHPELLKFIKEVLSYDGLSVLIETDGLLVTKEFCEKLKEILDNAKERTWQWPKILFLISMDSFTNETYKKIHGENNGNLEKSVEAVKLLKSVTKDVYPQFVRVNENEEELENFYRYWNEKTNASEGNLVIQKYDSFGGLLKDCKPADLSPIERNVCWHIRRDMSVLINGDVPLCKEFVFENIIGNIFTDGIETVWKKMDAAVKEHLENKYCEKCRNCDEYYTYNF